MQKYINRYVIIHAVIINIFCSYGQQLCTLCLCALWYRGRHLDHRAMYKDAWDSVCLQSQLSLFSTN